MAQFALVVLLLGHLPVAAVVPSLPQAFVDTTFAPPAGNTITVNAGGNLQAAINSAVPGDTIVLQAGATFTGTFTLPNKGASTNWIYIRTSAIATLPAPGNRVSPADTPKMATIVGTGGPVVAIQTATGAHHYRFVGIEFRPGPGLFSTGLIRVGAGETSLASLPNNIIFDRCYIHGDPTLGGRRGIALNGAASAVIDSHLSDWKEVGGDSQAILIWNSPGPLRIVNNHLEGAGENVMLGGADPTIVNLVPSDVEIRGNRFYKPVEWRPMSWTVKNLFELKNARRVLIEGNLFENDWAASQDYAINIKSSNQDGTAPWSGTEDLTFRHNFIKHGPSAIKFCARNCDGITTIQGGRFMLQNNVFEDISSINWGGAGNFFQTIGPVPGLVVNHNTIIHNGSTFSGGDGGDGANTQFEFTDNIAQRGPSGFKGTGTGEGTPTLNRFFPAAVFTKNALSGATSSLYPANNFFPSTYAFVRFVDLAGGNYRLDTTSLFRNAANDGRDVGADFNAVTLATGCALTGLCAAPLPPFTVISPFTFTPQSNVPPGSAVASNTVAIAGTNFTLPATISISGTGSYSIGCGNVFTTTVGLIKPGETVCVRYTAPAGSGVTSNTTITVNGVSATFTTTTGAALPPTADNDGDGIPNAVENAEQTFPFVKDNDVFTNARLFTMQQYRDIFGREGDTGGITFYTNLINAGASRPAIIEMLLNAPETQSVAGAVSRLYLGTFLRIPDYPGLTFQINTVRSGAPLTGVAENFTLSPEFQTTYGSLDNTQYVNLLYQNILGRAPSPAETAFHVNRLNTGSTRGDVLVGFTESPEYIAATQNEVYVVLVYADMLLRAPLQPEFSQWLAFLDGANPLRSMITTFFNSTEYRNRGFLP